MKTILRLALVAAVGLVSGCVTYTTLDAASRVKATAHLLPVVHAIEDYKKATGHLPATLADVEQQQKKTLTLEDKSDAGELWKIVYTNGGDTYRVAYHHSFCDLTYLDGNFEGWHYNPFR